MKGARRGRSRWPSKPEQEFFFPLDDNDLFNAAKFLAIVAYPRPAELAPDGPAHECMRALLARAFRKARRAGRIAALPDWVGEIPTQQMHNRLRMAFKRLYYARLAYMTLTDAELMLSEKEALADGQPPGFIVRQSADFSRVDFIFHADTRPLLPQLWRSAEATGVRSDGEASRAGDLKATLRSSIIRHRVAFGLGGRDDQEAYRYILARYVRPLFRVLHLAGELHQEIATYGETIAAQKRVPFDYLLMNPEWVAGAIIRAESGCGLAILRSQRMGVPLCHCGMVHFGRPES